MDNVIYLKYRQFEKALKTNRFKTRAELLRFGAFLGLTNPEMIQILQKIS